MTFTLCIFCHNNNFLKCGPGQPGFTSPGNLLEIQILGPPSQMYLIRNFGMKPVIGVDSTGDVNDESYPH